MSKSKHDGGKYDEEEEDDEETDMEETEQEVEELFSHNQNIINNNITNSNNINNNSNIPNNNSNNNKENNSMCNKNIPHNSTQSNLTNKRNSINKSKKRSRGSEDKLKGVRSVGCMTEGGLLGECEPGSVVKMPGFVWTDSAQNGMLLFKTVWKDRPYEGMLVEASHDDWSFPKSRIFASCPGSRYKRKCKKPKEFSYIDNWKKRNRNTKTKSRALRNLLGMDEFSSNGNSSDDMVFPEPEDYMSCREEGCEKKFPCKTARQFHHDHCHSHPHVLHSITHKTTDGGGGYGVSSGSGVSRRDGCVGFSVGRGSGVVVENDNVVMRDERSVVYCDERAIQERMRDGKMDKGGMINKGGMVDGGKEIDEVVAKRMKFSLNSDIPQQQHSFNNCMLTNDVNKNVHYLSMNQGSVVSQNSVSIFSRVFGVRYDSNGGGCGRCDGSGGGCGRCDGNDGGSVGVGKCDGGSAGGLSSNNISSIGTISSMNKDCFTINSRCSNVDYSISSNSVISYIDSSCISSVSKSDNSCTSSGCSCSSSSCSSAANSLFATSLNPTLLLIRRQQKRGGISNSHGDGDSDGGYGGGDSGTSNDGYGGDNVSDASLRKKKEKTVIHSLSSISTHSSFQPSVINSVISPSFSHYSSPFKTSNVVLSSTSFSSNSSLESSSSSSSSSYSTSLSSSSSSSLPSSSSPPLLASSVVYQLFCNNYSSNIPNSSIPSFISPSSTPFISSSSIHQVQLSTNISSSLSLTTYPTPSPSPSPSLSTPSKSSSKNSQTTISSMNSFASTTTQLTTNASTTTQLTATTANIEPDKNDISSNHNSIRPVQTSSFIQTQTSCTSSHPTPIKSHTNDSPIKQHYLKPPNHHPSPHHHPPIHHHSPTHRHLSTNNHHPILINSTISSRSFAPVLSQNEYASTNPPSSYIFSKSTLKPITKPVETSFQLPHSEQPPLPPLSSPPLPPSSSPPPSLPPLSSPLSTSSSSPPSSPSLMIDESIEECSHSPEQLTCLATSHHHHHTDHTKKDDDGEGDDDNGDGENDNDEKEEMYIELKENQSRENASKNVNSTERRDVRSKCEVVGEKCEIDTKLLCISPVYSDISDPIDENSKSSWTPIKPLHSPNNSTTTSNPATTNITSKTNINASNSATNTTSFNSATSSITSNSTSSTITNNQTASIRSKIQPELKVKDWLINSTKPNTSTKKSNHDGKKIDYSAAKTKATEYTSYFQQILLNKQPFFPNFNSPTISPPTSPH